MFGALLRPLTVAALAFAPVVSAPAFAQSPAGLLGTWVLDEARSDPAALPAGRGRGGFGGRGGVPPNQLQISQDGNNLTVSRGSQTFIYHLDGSETPGPPGGETKSTVAWDGGTLVVTWKREYFAGAKDGYVTATGKDAYALSGGVLTIERQSNDPRRGAQTVKAVYARSQ